MFGFVSARRHREELADARAQIEYQRERAVKADARAKTEIEARRSVTRQNTDLDAANARLEGQIKALSARLLEAQVASGFNPVQARRTAERFAALRKAAAEGREEAAKERAAAKRERKRASNLQKELDNALGLPPGGVLNSAPWRPGYQAERDKGAS